MDKTKKITDIEISKKIMNILTQVSQEEYEEILQREIKRFGKDGAHITGINPNHIGKIAQVRIKKKQEESTTKS